MDPVDSLVGTVLIGFGVILLYGSIKNRRIFGTAGLIPTALTTGSIDNLSQIPQAYKLNEAAAGVDEHKVTATWQIPIAVVSAIGHIADKDPSLAAQIDDRVRNADANTDRVQLMPLAQLLALADAKGFGADTAVIRVYVKGVTGESV